MNTPASVADGMFDRLNKQIEQAWLDIAALRTENRSLAQTNVVLQRRIQELQNQLNKLTQKRDAKAKRKNKTNN